MQMLSALSIPTRFALAAAAIGIWGAAQADVFPSRTVKLVVPFAPGGGADVPARLVAGRLAELWKQPVVVENKTGAGSIIATDSVAKSSPDGYTILANVALIVQNPSLHAKLPYDTFKDLRPVTILTNEQLLLVASAATGATTLGNLLASIKRAPAKYVFGSYGAGSTSHLLLQQLNQEAGVTLLHVPYKGTAAALQALLAGEAQVAILNYGTAKAQIDAGKLRALAVTGDKRFHFLPQVPTFEEQAVKGFTLYSWVGLFVNGATPDPVVEKIAADVTRVLALPDVTDRIRQFGQQPGGGTPQAFAEIFRRDFEYYARIIRTSGIRAD
ncbi:MAG: tripartite tricarboxylate transporter substrate binding protein [Burkholderiales bacterium]|nr:tripartite tricarboxylate transporter substrate binding protein [Burkholderiales bacterium]